MEEWTFSLAAGEVWAVAPVYRRSTGCRVDPPRSSVSSVPSPPPLMAVSILWSVSRPPLGSPPGRSSALGAVPAEPLSRTSDKWATRCSSVSRQQFFFSQVIHTVDS